MSKCAVAAVRCTVAPFRPPQMVPQRGRDLQTFVPHDLPPSRKVGTRASLQEMSATQRGSCCFQLFAFCDFKIVSQTKPYFLSVARYIIAVFYCINLTQTKPYFFSRLPDKTLHYFCGPIDIVYFSA